MTSVRGGGEGVAKKLTESDGEGGVKTESDVISGASSRVLWDL